VAGRPLVASALALAALAVAALPPATAAVTVSPVSLSTAAVTVPSAARALPPALVGPPGVRAEDAPTPPPVDADALPGDGTPGATPGAEQAVRCAVGLHQPDDRSLPALLWGQRLMALDQLHSLSTGRGVRIAVIDSGVSRHPLLDGRLGAGGDYVTGGNGLSDCDGHGTAVAGIAAGAADPATGFSGVAPGADVISIRQSSPSFRVTGADGTANPVGNLGTLARAVVHAVDLGADVINISEVSCAPANAGGSAQLHAALRAAVLRNVVVVAAAGNTGSGAQGECPDQPDNRTVAYPGWFDDDVLTVASVGPNGGASEFSYPGPWVDVAAPGERLMSLAANGSGLTDVITAEGSTSHMDGTSFAAPMVAGLAALIRARYPQLTARQVVDRITATAAQHASLRSDTLGYGVIDPVAALTRTPAVLPAPSGLPTAADTGLLPLPGAASGPAPAGPGALWGGALALLATLVVAALAVGRQRSGWRTPPPGAARPTRPGPPGGPAHPDRRPPAQRYPAGQPVGSGVARRP
jgi:membrane-anchored mycosin MYCP